MDHSTPSKDKSSVGFDLRLLLVEIVDASDLISCTSSGSNPHLSICLIDLATREIKTESFKAIPQFNTVSPKWNASFEFGKNHFVS